MIYIDSEFKCHTTNPDGIYQAVETDAFNGKCTAYIEGTRYVPPGMEWTREDGKAFRGEMVAPWVDSRQRDAAQSQYECDLADRADMEAAYNYLLTGETA